MSECECMFVRACVYVCVRACVCLFTENRHVARERHAYKETCHQGITRFMAHRDHKLWLARLTHRAGVKATENTLELWPLSFSVCMHLRSARLHTWFPNQEVGLADMGTFD